MISYHNRQRKAPEVLLFQKRGNLDQPHVQEVRIYIKSLFSRFVRGFTKTKSLFDDGGGC